MIIDEDIKRILSAPLPWERLKKKRVLVTGAGGMIGSYCAKVAEQLAFTAKVGREQIYADYGQHDFVIHAASPASPNAYCADPIGTIRANTIATENLLKVAKEGFLYLSSGEVYGEGAPTPTPESYSGPLEWLNPRNVYAQAKRTGESLCVYYAQQHGVPAKIGRISHTYGPGMKLHDGRVFSDFVGDIVAKRDIVMHSDGLARRPFCYLADTVTGLFTILLKGEDGQAYNVGAETETQILDLAVLLSEMYPPLKVIRQPESTNSNPIQGGHFDITRLKALGWEPKTGIEEGFRRTVQSYQ